MIGVFEHLLGEIDDVVARMESRFVQGDRAAVHNLVHRILRLDVVDTDAALDGQRDGRAVWNGHGDVHGGERLDEYVPVFLFHKHKEVVAAKSCNHFVIVTHSHDGTCKAGNSHVADSGGFGLVDVLVVFEVQEKPAEVLQLVFGLEFDTVMD